ncbi:uncharacterized protein P884DRAFT_256778 [Thermothelomyces heterothallicus CBS 202.75]|uniref:uncharacterized protein n=1 Tax=Thermothelomyces heterothallicus CBS 202.75 TaxID=1149848 RepID=UPI0037441E9D
MPMRSPKYLGLALLAVRAGADAGFQLSRPFLANAMPLLLSTTAHRRHCCWIYGSAYITSSVASRPLLSCQRSCGPRGCKR